ncbi:50S ribosomal protein L11 methyltransferase [Sinorhizobium mexicanum]|uniref:Ribosomal protein L11 methyltransferase n=1 Tax=Sinorhizobium mexicanum TaxID=375549 RepID=A0A859QYP3_9HYPH|nr:50S ribosomal protein L11 methyltransferase [Sinorhizobium mexicanum]MBP1883294.1 ribosomal protein L11 methyltransferase [Sinorhizobium mexicanum]QLL62498.1 50S ribosomal protein L11 methyltransferase [Sinorhizobium mexicanum]
MSEIRLFVTSSEKQVEAVLDVMSTIFEDEDFAIATMEIDEKRDVWEASVYMMADEEESVRVRLVEALAADFSHLPIEREVLPDIDWIAKSLEGLAPVRAGRFVIHGSHDREKVRTGEIAIEIDAGQAFGTGHHGTTAGCLEVLASVAHTRPVRNVLDLGTGSGVLAIAAWKLLHVPVLATDIDAIATRVASENARRNGVVTGMTFATAPGFHSTAFSANGPFDLIIANILARPLMKMAPQLVANLTPGGSVILSGILAEQRWKVLAAYNGQRLKHERTIWRNGWVTIHLTK